MNIVLFLVLVLMGVFEYQMGRIILSESGSEKLRENRMFFILCVAGFIWCMGYACMGMSNNELLAYVFRSIGLLGIGIFCPTIVFFIYEISPIEIPYFDVFKAFAIFGAAVSYIMLAIPRAVRMVNTSYGYSFYSNLWIGRYINYLYLIILFGIWFYIGFNWFRSATLLREKAIVRYMLYSGVLFIAGNLFDGILPVFGIAAFPSSAMTTFVAVSIIYLGIKKYNSISLSNQDISNNIFKNVDIPVVVCDGFFRIIDCNDVAFHYVGGNREQLIGGQINDWVDAISEEERVRIKAELLNGVTKFEIDLKMHRTANVCTVTVSVIYDSYGEVVCMIGIISDRTKYLDFKQKIDENEKNIELAIAAKDAFYKSISTGVINPIKDNIRELSKLAGGDDISDEKREQVNRVLERESDLLVIVADMLDVSLMESGNFKIENYKYDIRDLLVEIINEIAPEINDPVVKFVVQISASVPRILIGDRKRIKQLIMNLLNNAVEYTRSGHITLLLSYRIKYGLVSLHFQIADTGIGMRQEDMNLIFGPTDTSDGRDMHKLGTGLGLTICRNIVRFMDGEISVRSALGKGTSYTIGINQKTDSEKAIVPYAEYKDKLLLLEEFSPYSDAMEQLVAEMGVTYYSLLIPENEDIALPEDDGYTVVLVDAGILGRMKLVIERMYPEARIVPIYSYNNYKKLSDSESGICRPFAFTQLSELLN